MYQHIDIYILYLQKTLS